MKKQKHDVTKNRHMFIGGSDVPIIMSLSKFKTRYQLLLEKAQLVEPESADNIFTRYGNIMEDRIRKCVNQHYIQCPFEESKETEDYKRYHADGYNGYSILEIKTTSDMPDVPSINYEPFKKYLVQLLFGVLLNRVTNGLLAVYRRTDDENGLFDEVFDEKNLQRYHVYLLDYEQLVGEINLECDRFWDDLQKMISTYTFENRIMDEEEFLPKSELVPLANKVIGYEEQLAKMKLVEKQIKTSKDNLLAEMEKHDVITWTTPKGTKITRVKGSQSLVFDSAMFKKEKPDIAKNYQKPLTRKPYIKITLKDKK